jgi:hypothetical protein
MSYYVRPVDQRRPTEDEKTCARRRGSLVIAAPVWRTELRTDPSKTKPRFQSPGTGGPLRLRLQPSFFEGAQG